MAEKACLIMSGKDGIYLEKRGGNSTPGGAGKIRRRPPKKLL